MTLRRAARCALAGACAIHARAGASELNLLEQERAAVSSAVYPRDPAAQADACGNLAEDLDGGFGEIATMFCDPDEMLERALRTSDYKQGLRAAKAVDEKLAQESHALFGGRVGVALTRRTKEPIQDFAKAVAEAWGLTGDASFLVALRGGAYPAVAIVGPRLAPASGRSFRGAAERLATRLVAQGRPGEAVEMALAAVLDAYGGEEVQASAPAEATPIEEAHGLEVEVFGCGHDPLNSTATSKSLLQEMAKAAGLKALDEVTYQFEPQGVTSLLMVEESHLAIHTWPEFGYAALDVVSGTGLRAGFVDDLLGLSKKLLECGEVTGRLTTRRHPLSRRAARVAAASAAGRRDEL